LSAAIRLADEPADAAVPLLVGLLEDPRTSVQEAAADALRAMPDPRARAALVNALAHASEWTRVIAAMVLAIDHEPLAWPVLEAALDSDDSDVYSPALAGLWLLDGERARPLTERLARGDQGEPHRGMASWILGQVDLTPPPRPRSPAGRRGAGAGPGRARRRRRG
jgi:HEAT repeat protein